MLINLQAVIELDPEHVTARIQYATLLVSNLQVNEALQQVVELLRVRPDFALAITQQGIKRQN